MQLGFFTPQPAPQAQPMAAPLELEDADRAWIRERAPRFTFAASMAESLTRYGRLTPNQLAAVRRLRLQDEQRANTPSAASQDATAGALELAFKRAKDRGIKYPKLTFDRFTFSPAGEKSSNAGAIYVKRGRGYEGLYLGKVLGGQFHRSRDCDSVTADAVLATLADPHAAAVTHGKQWGTCAVCNRALTDADSVARGIGPVCAERMGWN